MNAAVPTLIVRLDRREHRVPAGTTLAALVASLGHQAKAVSTAVGGEFVARGDRESRVLKEGDAVSLFQPIAGG